MEKFLITQDVDTALLFKKQGFKLAGQDGKTWYFVNDEDRVEMNKSLFARKKVKYTTTNKMFFADFNGVQYVKD